MEKETGFAGKGEILLSRSITIRELVFAALLILCASSLIAAPVALLLGTLAAHFIGHPFLKFNHKVTHLLLQFSVVGLGFGMDLNTSLEAGRQGFVFSVVS
ncbi:MAG: putative sulfate exporter family transporter, partial [Chitinophagaceae bacterium]|nr:putative sulfate exporter family transporter [Chitinophagaceae bacterium]